MIVCSVCSRPISHDHDSRGKAVCGLCGVSEAPYEAYPSDDAVVAPVVAPKPKVAPRRRAVSAERTKS